MACQGLHSWTLSGLIGAFVDLVIAYLLLCVSVVAFFASKFLGLVGLSLPCPCDGVLVNPNGNICFQRLLVNSPSERVSSVQLSLKSKFPFGSTWERDRNYQLNVKLVRNRDSCADELVEMESEGSCSSRKSNNMDTKDLVLRNESNMGLSVFNSSLDLREGNFDFKGKGSRNQRPRIAPKRRRKVNDHGKTASVSEFRSSCSDGRSPYEITRKGFQAFESSPGPVFPGFGLNQVHNNEVQVIKNIGKSSSPGLELEYVNENNPTAKYVSSSEGMKSNGQIDLLFNDDAKNEIRILEQALEQEHAARSALYLELEKERNAAATAADEAMSMILRLQEEKASVEMEARQFQRMIEEKSTYDAEEMNILKEIIMRRERENHFLEKEVEAYRAMVYDGNTSAELGFNLDLEEDPGPMLRQLSDSIDNHGITKDKVSLNEVGDTQMPSTSDEHDFDEKVIVVSGEQREENDDFEPKGVATKSSETPDVIDVHVIDNKLDLQKGSQGEESEARPENCGVKTVALSGRSNSCVFGVDNERLKIDSEVEWLRERLRIVQEGRDKLNFSLERQESEMFQVQLLEDIACQLREIRQLTSPGKAVRQASLPILPPKVMSKKKRHRSVSIGVHKN